MTSSQKKIMACTKLFAVWGLLFLASLHYISGTPRGSVLLMLRNLENPGNTDHQGKCCNGSCSSCDYQLSIWVTCDGKTSDTDCLYGEGKTGLFYNASGISFNQDLGNGLPNPLAYNFTIFQGNLGIMILATDKTGSKIHDYKFHKSIYPKYYAKRAWSNATLPVTRGRSRIELSYQVYCKEHYYTPSCTVGCAPGANYRCNENTGGKLCNSGWTGPNCTCKTGSHQYNCDISTGRRLCYPSWFGEKCDVKCQARNDGLSGYTCDSHGGKVCRSGWYGNECNEATPVEPRISSTESSTKTPQKKISSTILAKSSKGIVSTQMNSIFLLTTKNTYRFISAPGITSSHVMPTFLTLSPLTSSRMTSSPKTSSPMTSSDTTSKFVTPSKSHLLPSYVFSTHVEGGIMSRPKSTIRDHTGQTVNSYPQTTIFTTNYSASLKPFSLYVGFTERLSKTAMDITGTSRVIKDRTEIIREQTEVTRDIPETTKEHVVITRDRTRVIESVPQMKEPTVFAKWISRDKTHHFEHRTMRSEVVPVIISTVTHEHETSCKTCDVTIKQPPRDTDVTITQTTRGIEVTITPTTRDTSFEPGSKDARKQEDVWWKILLPFIIIAILIGTAIAVYKMKNRKRCEVSPHHETSMKDFKVKPDDNENRSMEPDHDQENTRSRNILDDETSGKKDLEAIWRVMSTSNE